MTAYQSNFPPYMRSNTNCCWFDGPGDVARFPSVQDVTVNNAGHFLCSLTRRQFWETWPRHHPPIPHCKFSHWATRWFFTGPVARPTSIWKRPVRSSRARVGRIFPARIFPASIIISPTEPPAARHFSGCAIETSRFRRSAFHLKTGTSPPRGRGSPARIAARCWQGSPAHPRRVRR